MVSISINLKKGAIDKPKQVVGIDLGTTNSLVAIVDPESGKPFVLKQNEQDILVPSIIHFDTLGNKTIGQKALPYLVTEPENTIYSVKRLLGRSYEDLKNQKDRIGYTIIDDDNTDTLVKVRVKDKFYSPIELSAEILKELKFKAEKIMDCEVKQAVITVPAYFNDSQRQATRDAGKLAGLDVMRIVNEPTAASLAYGIGLDQDKSKTVAVYDFGGGTFDVSILRIEAGIFEVLSTRGNTFLGGDDFDHKIVDYWIAEHDLSVDKKANQELRLLAEKAKIHLSENSNYQGDFHSKTVMLKRETFDELIKELVNQTIESCREAMQDAELSVNDIDDVVLVGGSTRVASVRESVAAYFKKEQLNNTINPDEVVALGAAIEADILSGNRTDVLLLDVTPLSLGIETLGGLMDTIITRNSKVPCGTAREYTTSVDGQVNLKISVFQGERDTAKDNRQLAEFELRGIPAMPAGMPKIEIKFVLDADGILSVTAKELRSGHSQSISIKPQYGLSDEQVETMLMDSFKNAQSDMEHRSRMEAISEAEQLIYSVERFIKNNAHLLSGDELSKTSKFVSNLQTSLASGSKDEILAMQDDLNEYTKPFAEKAMDESISKALKGKKIE
jgi:molecular chaperone HscA